MVDYFDSFKMICCVFSLPFKFHRLQDITNNIPNIVFNSVTHLELWDNIHSNMNFSFDLLELFHFLKIYLFQIFNHHFGGFTNIIFSIKTGAQLLNILILFHLTWKKQILIMWNIFSMKKKTFFFTSFN